MPIRKYVRWPALPALLGPAVLLLAAGAEPSSSAGPRYDARGELIRPSGYYSWVFVGADLAPSYQRALSQGTDRKDPAATGHPAATAGDFHHIYINREAYEHYRKTDRFPDPTILVMENFRSETRDPKGILTSGQVEGRRVGLETAVKDSRRPGGGVPWAYYNFDNTSNTPEEYRPAGTAVARARADCYDCHLKWADKDNVWVQFYPLLRDADLGAPSR